VLTTRAHEIAGDRRGVTVTPLSPTIGAEIGGVDLRTPFTAAQVAAVEAALLDWKVLVFRDQHVTTEEHLAFARNFGELEVHPLGEKMPGHPEVSTLYHHDGHPGTENHWHHDVTWRLRPSLGSIARMLETPAVGGDTLFADMGAAYDGLPARIKYRVDGRLARHDFPHFRDLMRRRGFTEPAIARFGEEFPNPRHPVIRTHPRTGHRAIFVNAAFTQEIVGISASESAELLAILERQASIPEYQVRVRWHAGTVVFWDNRACQHYAVSDYRPHVRRVERVTIAGDTPFFDPRRPTRSPDGRFYFSAHVDRHLGWRP
jgi:taurine dioxygenase